MIKYNDFKNKIKNLKTTTLLRELYTLYKCSFRLPNNSKLLEIGSGIGASTIALGLGCLEKNSSLITVDSFFEAERYNKYDLSNGWSNSTLLKNLKLFNLIPKTVTSIISSSDNFFKENINTFDLIFIDGSHKYEDVKKDYFNSLNCLKPNGIIIFHDYAGGSKEVTDFITQELLFEEKVNILYTIDRILIVTPKKEI